MSVDSFSEVLILGTDEACLDRLCQGLSRLGVTVRCASWTPGKALPQRLLKGVDVVLTQVLSSTSLTARMVSELRGKPGRRLVVVGVEDEVERVRLLDAGAAACLGVGPSEPELLARVLAVLRPESTRNRRLTFHEGELSVDLVRPQASYRGWRLNLSADEYDSLRELAVRVMESRCRFDTGPGAERVTNAVRRLSDYAEVLEDRTQSMRKRASTSS